MVPRAALLAPPVVPAQDTEASPPRPIHAVRVAEPLRIDGRIDEEFYCTAPPTSDFVQIEREDGAPATE
jgi:hypothetical protein